SRASALARAPVDSPLMTRRDFMPTTARSYSLCVRRPASSWRRRSLEELAGEIDACALGRVNDYLARRDLGRMTVCTLGPEKLTPPDGV
ncbi:MAG: hypothetical protein ACF8QF_02650, partial [Phycisphaerales bacterium]